MGRHWMFLSALIMVVGLVIVSCAPAPAASPAPASPAAPAAQPAAPAASAPPDKPAAPEKPIKLAMAVSYPPDGAHGKNVISPFVTEVEKRTNGRIQVEVFWSETLFKQKEQLEAIATGKLDMGGFLSSNFISGQIPEIELLFVPFLFDNGQHFKRAWEAGLGDMFEELFARENIILLGNSTALAGKNHIFVKKIQAKLPADLNGLKMRSFNRMLDVLLLESGAAPVSMGSTDVYLALQRGTADGYVTTMASTQAFKLYEVVDHALMVPLSLGLMTPFGVAKDVWASIPDDLKAIMTEVADDVNWKWNLETTAQTDAEVLALLQKEGLTIHEPTPAEMVEWRRVAQRSWEEFVQRTGERGQKMIDIAQQTR